MQITITIDAEPQEAAALLAQIQALFGDRVTVTLPETITSADAPAPAAPPVEPQTPPIPVTEAPEPETPPGRGQIFRNPDLTGEHVVYGEGLVGVKAWGVRSFTGVPRLGGETQPVRCEPKREENSFEGYDRYLQAAYAGTALEMGGSFRTFNWEVYQDNVAVREGFAYDLMAAFHPIIKNRDGGGEHFMSIDAAGDWMSNLEWRWVVRSMEGDELAADAWQDGETLGTLSFDLPFDQPHEYTYTWRSDRSGAVIFALEFRNKWGLAMTSVWFHGARCVER